jgi:hypothetical protein
MICKTLSVKQPYAAFICAGVKTVENRTWKTDYRGRLLIHASGDNYSYPNFYCLPKPFQKELLDIADKNDWTNASPNQRNYSELIREAYEFYGQDWEKQESPEVWLKEAVKKHGYFLESYAIIGECELIDIIQNSDDMFAERGCYHWILNKAKFYDKFIYNVAGRLRLWNFDLQD